MQLHVPSRRITVAVLACAATMTLLAPAPDAHAGTTSRPVVIESVNARSEGEARERVLDQIRTKWGCLALAGETTRLIVDSSDMQCRQYGMQEKRWGCKVRGTCEVSGPNVGRSGGSSGGASRQ